MRGLDEARALYEEYGAPMLHEKFPGCSVCPMILRASLKKRSAEAMSPASS